MAIGAEHAGPSHGASHLGEAPRVARLRIYGRPGGHANLLLRQARQGQLTQWAIGAAICAAGAGVYQLTSSWIAAAAFIVVGIAFGKLRGAPYETAAGRARVGRDAERLVAKALNKWGKSHGATVIAHGGYPGSGGDIDHMLFGGRAVVIETKYGRGKISLNGTSITAGNRTIPGDPIAQCLRQRNLVVRRTGLPVLAVVCVSEGTGPIMRVGDVIVCSAKTLPKALAQASPCATPSDAGLQACGVTGL
jgi:hypothetical protein